MAISTAIDANTVARALGIKTDFKRTRQNGTQNAPMRVIVIGQGNSASTYATTKATVTRAFDVGTTYGFGSPLHLACKQLLPENGDGVGTIPVTLYPLVDDVSGVPAAGDVTPSGSATGAASFVVRINEIDSGTFTVASGDTVATIVTAMTAAVAAELDLPMLATDSTTTMGLTAKWDGSSGNDLVVEIVATSTTDSSGITFAITQPTSGATNPDVDTATAQIGNVWETLVVNCMEASDTGTLTKLATYNEGRWDPLVYKPLVSFTTEPEAVVATAIAVPDARKSDRTNCQLSAPGSIEFPAVLTARAVARIARSANNEPANDFARLPLSTLTPGTDAQQWTLTQRNAAVLGGSSTTEVVDGVMQLKDTVTMYHPDGETAPPYRKVRDIIVLMNYIFSLNEIFNSADWDGKPLVPNTQATTNPNARKPKNALAELYQMADNLALRALLSDPEGFKATALADIGGVDNNRLDIVIYPLVSGTVDRLSIDNNFGFYYGTSAVIG